MDSERKRAADGIRADLPVDAELLDGAHFRFFADCVPALLAIMTPTGQVETVNRHVLEYFGATLEQLRDWQMSDMVHPDDLAAVIAAWQRSVQTGEPYDIEHRSRRHDGVYRWFHVRAMRPPSNETQVTRWCVLQTDIDERKRAEFLATGEKKLLEMVATGTDLSVVLTELCRLLDSVADGCVSGALLLDRSHTRARLAVSPGLPVSYNRALEGQVMNLEQGPCGTAATLKRQIIVPDVAKETRWDSDAWPALATVHGIRSCWSTPVLSRSGESVGTFSIYQRSPSAPAPYHQTLIQQLTQVASIAIERSSTEEALKRGQAVLAEAQVVSATGNFSLEPASGLHWWSEQTYRIFGFEPGEPVTFDMARQRCHPDDLHLMNLAIEHAERVESHSTELRLLMPDGAVRYIQLGGHAFTSSADSPPEFVGAVRDVTDRRLSEEALGRARSELAHAARVTSLGMLTASIAHELNQPLSGIVTNASTGLRMLTAAQPNIEGACETTRRTLRDANRAADVISRLRSLFGSKFRTTEVVDLNAATAEVLAVLRSEFQRGRIVLKTQLGEELRPVTGDRVQLQQVILNLLLNAVAAMSSIDDRPRELLVRTECEAEHVCLTVQDAGVGIGEQDLERLFDAFYTTKSEGMGIGLSVGRTIIESHNGRLWAVSNDGPGATFAFSIPCGPGTA